MKQNADLPSIAKYYLNHRHVMKIMYAEFKSKPLHRIHIMHKKKMLTL